MTYLCLKCGEKENFEQKVWGTEKFSEIHLLDKEGDYIDSADYESYDSDIHDRDTPFCQKCREEVEDYSQKEYVEMIFSHTKKDGSWSEEELPEDEKDQSIIDSIIANKV